MAWWPWAKRVRSAVRFIRAKFDSAQTTDANRRHWAQADALAADAAASPMIRRTLRMRARYEVANNSYARGIVLTLANDVVGTGPRLQMLLGGGENESGAGAAATPTANQIIERAFAAWAKEVDLPGKLRTMRIARAQDGEAFGLKTTNPRLQSPVKLDIRLIEADQVATPGYWLGGIGARGASAQGMYPLVDGIVFDEHGNPEEYHVLKSHPGSLMSIGSLQYDSVSAENVLHWFRADRPGQHRGLPDILPALPLFAQLRRYTLAVISAAESAANIAIFMKTSAPAGGEAADVEPMATMEFEPNMAVFGPEGWEPSQIRAEQPTTTYREFKGEILNEIARCLNMPYNVAACNSSGYNYASGRLDHQTYFKSIRVEQAQLEAVVLDSIFDAWMAEAVKVFGLEGIDAWPHQWFWDGHEHVDPAKEASAQAQRLASSTTTLASEYARQGKDWETEIRQRAKEVALMKELGLPLAAPKGATLEPEGPTEEETDHGNNRNAA